METRRLMKFRCMSCASKYSVPDDRVAAAGRDGLRVRCSKCRAIMVVSSDHPSRIPGPAIDDDATVVPRARASAPRSSSGGGMGGLGGQLAALDSLAPQPAHLSESGVYRPLPGVRRDVTGLFFAELDAHSKAETQRVAARIWYIALAGTPRGPYSAHEMIGLADAGKLSGVTLVWRPGFSSWRRVRGNNGDAAEDLSWLYKAVVERRRREERAQQHAQDQKGIRPIDLQSPRIVRSRSQTPGFSVLPPPLPTDAVDDAPTVIDARSPFQDAVSIPPALALAVDALARVGEASPTTMRRAFVEHKTLIAVACALWLALAALVAGYALPATLAAPDVPATQTE